MKKHVYLRVKVDPALRHAFQLSAWREDRSPSQKLRSIMETCVRIERHVMNIDVEVWGDSFPLESDPRP